MAEITIDLGYFSTTGQHWQEPCRTVPRDEGRSFQCLTHHCPCVVDEGWFCPRLLESQVDG